MNPATALMASHNTKGRVLLSSRHPNHEPCHHTDDVTQHGRPWMEGPALIEDILLENNTFHYGKGVNPIHANTLDTSNIVEHNNHFLD
jgi:hypothetical protein